MFRELYLGLNLWVEKLFFVEISGIKVWVVPNELDELLWGGRVRQIGKLRREELSLRKYACECQRRDKVTEKATFWFSTPQEMLDFLLSLNESEEWAAEQRGHARHEKEHIGKMKDACCEYGIAVEKLETKVGFYFTLTGDDKLKIRPFTKFPNLFELIRWDGKEYLRIMKAVIASSKDKSQVDESILQAICSL